MPLPRPCFSHSLATTVFDAEAAVIDNHKSDSVCLLLENSHSTDILTPIMAKISRATRDRIGKSAACFCIWRSQCFEVMWREYHYLPPCEDISIRTRKPPAEVIVKFRDKCLLLIGCHAENRIHEDGLSWSGWRHSSCGLRGVIVVSICSVQMLK